MLDPELLKILACPACKAPVKELADGSSLDCGKCNRRYPVVDGIPNMLVDPEPSPKG